MLDLERVWARVSQREEFRGRKLADYGIQVIETNFTLTTGQVSAATPVQFSGGAVILGVMAGARPSAVAATQTYAPGLDLFSLQLEYQGPGQRAIISGGAAMASSVFGQYGDQFPKKEIVLPVNSTLLYTLTNLTTSTILVTLSHHCLVPAAVG